MYTKLKTLTISLVFTLFIFLFIYIILLLAQPIMTSLAPATCMPDDCFCERIYQNLILQPINTFSSLAFVFIGSYLLVQRVLFDEGGIATRYISVLLMLIGTGSFIYHATLTLVGQFLDVASMYALASFMVSYAIYRNKKSGFLVSFVLLNTVLDSILIVWPESRRFVFGLVFVAGVTLEILFQLRTHFSVYFVIGLATFIASYAIWILDRYRLLCFPDLWFQGHAIWHVLNAVASYFLCLYYESIEI